jgi:hypothetical protein
MMKIRMGALLITSLLTACSIGGGSNTEDLPALSDSTIAASTTSPDEIPTTVVPSVSQPECDLAALSPDEDVTGLVLLECLGDWMITYYEPCGECEGVTPFHAEDGVWKSADALYVYCYSKDYSYGQSPETDVLTSLQIIVAGYPCDETDKAYHPEKAQGQLKFGDVGNRVKSLQTALINEGFLNDSADGSYGPNTMRAVMNFQYSQNLTADALAGADTHEALGLKFP